MTICGALGLLLTAALSSASAADVWTGVERIVVIGDLHADYDQTVAVLRSAELIDADLNWSGGKTHMVQAGDAIDRGPAPRKVLDLLMKLEAQAPKAGGYVHALIGNHEAINVSGDFRYVNPAAFAEFAGAENTSKKNGDRPAGYAEYAKQFGRDGKYGKWIRRHNAVIRINGFVIVHGGISPKYAALALRDINEGIRREMADPDNYKPVMTRDPDGPLWYRQLANGDENLLGPEVDATLKSLDARRIIIGHTFSDGAITPRFSGKVLMVDVGLARLYDQFSRLACLVIDRDQPYALHRGRRLELPSDNGPGMLAYLKTAARLDPQPSSLLSRIQKLEAQLEAATPAPK